MRRDYDDEQLEQLPLRRQETVENSINDEIVNEQSSNPQKYFHNEAQLSSNVIISKHLESLSQRRKD